LQDKTLQPSEEKKDLYSIAVDRGDAWLHRELKKYGLHAINPKGNNNLPKALQNHFYYCHHFVMGMLNKSKEEDEVDYLENLPKTSIPKSQAIPGDIVYYQCENKIEHSALIVGKNAEGELIAVSKFGLCSEYLYFHPVKMVFDYYGEMYFSRSIQA
jgi:hypothetical protein